MIDTESFTTNTTLADMESVIGMSFLLISLVCLGTWPAILRLCSIEQCPSTTILVTSTKPPRDNRFAYLDYAIAYVVSSSIPLLITALKEREDTGSSSSSSWILIMIAMIGGTLLSFGNISMQWSTTVFGAPLTTVVALQASMTVTLGTSINYLLEPEKTPRPQYLFGGVIVFLIAIVLASKAHMLYGKQQQHQQQQQKKYSDRDNYSGIEMMGADINSDDNDHQLTEESGMIGYGDDEDVTYSSFSSSEGEEDLEIMTVHSSNQTLARKALVVAALGGFCFGFFSPAFNIAVNDPFGIGSEPDMNGEEDGNSNTLSVTVANLWFSFAFALASIVGNLVLIYKPPVTSGLKSTTFSEYWNEDFSDRYLAICAGMICGVANLLQFKGGSMVGFATADLVQAYPLVSTCWDVFLFGEFAKAGLSIRINIVAMYVMYMCGIFLIIASAI